ncbi:3'-5' exonuclease [Helicobacter sp. MIT 14-3879]|uniref:3'-5' exonuclease n=1 Tax=Helicobacter sp. MIT 14-3879 TaxID=2040649 RepID=UPI000E1FA253|nr:3'-5' exonuclease [Helicobacter sp. MIT 14-3879]RDU61483.1 hypothetical protein CQA44_08715 [Helicobacter sp. MIT 14-3879]
MNLTDEQTQIIELSKKLKANEILSIQACAGSGKTFTLREIVLNNPKKKYLYLAFNKAIVKEVISKFPPNVEIKTLHSLALSYTKKKLGVFQVIKSLSVFDIAKIFKGENQLLILLLEEFNRFLRSNEEIASQHSNIKILYQAVLDKKLPMFHNFYLKFYALAKDKHLESHYDCLLLDEAQDTNAVMLSIFLHNRCAKILAGDTFQNIYGFNQSINAFNVLNPTYNTTLSTSFRCTQNILDYANFFLKTFSTKDFISMRSNAIQGNIIHNRAFISRTNAGMIEFIASLEEKESKDFSLLKEPRKIFSPIFAILHFKKAQFDLIPKEYAYFKNFNHIKELYYYIETIQDKELLSALNLLRKDLNLTKLTKRVKNLFYNKNAKNFIINAHQAKGLEWDNVVLLDDFFSLMEIKENIIIQKQSSIKEKLYLELEQELNLFYVAITRAKYQLIDKSKNYKFWLNREKIKNLSSHSTQGDFINVAKC